MPENFADRLLNSIQTKNSVACLGLDISYDRLPQVIREDRNFNDPANTEVVMDAVLHFAQRVLKVAGPHVAAVKINSAFFERYYADGMAAYFSLVQEAQSQNLPVIGDVKRADVADSGAAYAEAHLAEPTVENLEEGAIPDAVTTNPYMGFDGIKPFVEVAAAQGKGVFVLIRTSNPSAGEFQDFSDAAGRKLYQAVAEKCAQWAQHPGLMGQGGYSSLGGVVGGTYPAEARQLREVMPHCLFLIPGYGTQGAGPQDCVAGFAADGRGGLVAASRLVLYAYDNPVYYEQFPENWEKCIEQAAADMKTQLNRALEARAGS